MPRSEPIEPRLDRTRFGSRTRPPERCLALRPSYTIGMKTAISLPDEVFEQAEQAAKRMKLSRSELYSRALSEYLARHTDSEVTAAINAAITEAGQPADPALSAHNRRRVLESEW